MQNILNFQERGISYHVYKFNGHGQYDTRETIKDVGALETILYAVNQGANLVVNITSGNYGEALKRAALEYNKDKPLEDRIKVVHIICPGDKKLEHGLNATDSTDFNYSIVHICDA